MYHTRGTKYSTFPLWLDSWLRMRKQLGLLMLFSASIHACIYLFIPPGTPSTEIPTPLMNGQFLAIYQFHLLLVFFFLFLPSGTWDWSEMMTVSLPKEPYDWRVNLYLMAGVLGYAVAILLGLSSLPSISAALSWREFRLFQSHLGWLCLLLSTTHCTLIGWEKLVKWNDCMFPGLQQIALPLPAITIILKIPLLLPCLDARLTAIRSCKS